MCQNPIPDDRPGASRPAPGNQPRLDAIDHVALQVEDIAEAVRWYRARLHCEIDYLDDTWALLRFANMKLALVVPGQHPPHLAVTSPVAEEFGELKTHRDGSASCYISDPGGNVLEVMKV